MTEKKVQIVLEYDIDYINGIVSVMGLHRASDKEKNTIKRVIEEMAEAPINLSDETADISDKDIDNIKLAILLAALSGRAKKIKDDE